MTLLALYRQGIATLQEHHIPQADLDCAFFLSHLLSLPVGRLFLDDHQLTTQQQAQFNDFVRRRCCHEPLAYIMGEQEFWSLTFHVNGAVLIPRPETEILVEEVLAHIDEPGSFHGKILDMGTGSGILPVTLATELPSATFVALDISGPALAVARKNCQRHQVDNRVSLIQSSWQSALRSGPCFDIIVTNPPYVDPATFAGLQPDVVDFEPHLALSGGDNNGSEVISSFCPDIVNYLKPGGWFFMEIGYDQQSFMTDLVASHPDFINIDIRHDYASLPRVILAQRRLPAPGEMNGQNYY